MAHTHTAVLALVVTLSLIAMTNAAGKVYVNQIMPVAADTVTFWEELHTPSGHIDTLNSGTFDIRNQFELRLGVPSIVLNGQTGGLDLAGSLGTYFSFDRSMLVSADTDLKVDAAGLTLLSLLSSWQSTNGSISFTSGANYDVSTLGLAAITTGDTRITSTGGIQLTSTEDFVAVKSAAFSSTIGKQINLSSATLLLGGSTVSIVSTDFSSTGVSSMVFNGDTIDVGAATSLSLKGESFVAQSTVDSTYVATGALSLSAFRTLSVEGDSVLLTGASSVYQTTGISANIEFKGSQWAVNSLNSVSLSASGSAGLFSVHAAANISLSSGTAAVTGSMDVAIGHITSLDTTLFGTSQLLVNAGSWLSRSYDTTFKSTGATNFNIGSKLTGNAATSLKLTGTNGLSITSSLPGPITLSSGVLQPITVSGGTVSLFYTSLLVDAGGLTSVSGTQTLSASNGASTITSGSGQDVRFLGGAVTLLGSGLSSTSTYFDALVNNNIEINGASVNIQSNGRTTVQADGPVSVAPVTDVLIDGYTVPSDATIEAVGTIFVKAATDTRFQSEGALLIHGNDGSFVSSTQTNIGSQAQLSFIGDHGVAVSAGTISLAAETAPIDVKASNVNYQFASTLDFTTGPTKVQSGRHTIITATTGDNKVIATGNLAVSSDDSLFAQAATNILVQATDTTLQAIASQDQSLTAASNVLFTDSTGFALQSSGRSTATIGRDLSVNATTTTLKLDAGHVLSVSSAARVDALASKAVTVNGGEINVLSGVSKTITVAADGALSVKATREAPRTVTVTGRATSVQSGVLSVVAGEANLFGKDVLLSGGTVSVGSVQDVITTSSVLVVEGNQTLTLTAAQQLAISSGVDDYIDANITNGITFTAGKNIEVYGETGVELFARNDLDVKATGRIGFLGKDELLFRSDSSTTLTSNTASSDTSVNVKSGGRLLVQTITPLNDVTLTSKNDWFSTGITETFVADGGNSAGCGVELTVNTGTSAHFSALNEWSIIHGRNGVAVSALNTMPTTPGAGRIEMQSTDGAFLHAEDGAVLLQAQGVSTSGLASLLVTSSDPFGNIDVVATQASVVGFGVGVTAESGAKLSVVGNDGVDVVATAGDFVAFTSDFFIEGARGLNISGGSVVPPIAGAVSLVSQNGDVTALGASEVDIISVGSVAGASGVGVSVSAPNGVSFSTQNGNDIVASAAGGVSFTATTKTLTFASTGGDTELRSRAGDVTFTSTLDTSIAAADGPVEIRAHGTSGEVAFKSANGWSVTAVKEVRMTANDDATIMASAKLTLTTLHGDVRVATDRITDDVQFIADGAVSVTAQGQRLTPEDQLIVRGNAVAYEATVDSVQFSSTQGVVDIGRQTNPTISVNAGNDGTSGVTFSSQSRLVAGTERIMRATAATAVTFAAQKDLLMESADGAKFTALSPAAQVLISAQQDVVAAAESGEARAFGQVKLTSARTLTLESVGVDEGDGVFVAVGGDLSLLSDNSVTFSGQRFSAAENVGTWSASTSHLKFAATGLTRNQLSSVDPGTLVATAGTDLSIKSDSTLLVRSNSDLSDVTFSTSGAGGNLKVSTTDATSDITLQTANGAIELLSNTFGATSADSDVVIRSDDAQNQGRGSVIFTANGNIDLTSTTASVPITGLVLTQFSTTQKNSNLLVQSNGAVNFVANNNITVATAAQEEGDIQVQSAQLISATATGASGVVHLSASNSLKLTALNDALTQTVTSAGSRWDVNSVSSGISLTANPTSGVVTFTTQADNTMLINTRRDNSNIEFKNTADAQTWTCLVGSTCSVTLQATNGVDLRSTDLIDASLTNGPMRLSATGYVSLSASLDATFTVGAANTFQVLANGRDIRKNTAITVASLSNEVDITAQRNLNIFGAQEVAFVESSVPGIGPMLVKSTAKEIIVGAQADDGSVVVRAISNNVQLQAPTSLTLVAGDALESHAGAGSTAISSSTGTMTLTTAPSATASDVSIQFISDIGTAGPFLTSGVLSIQAADYFVDATGPSDTAGTVRFSTQDIATFTATSPRDGVALTLETVSSEIQLYSSSRYGVMTLTAAKALLIDSRGIFAPVAKVTTTGNLFVSSDSGSVSIQHTGASLTSMNVGSFTTTANDFAADIHIHQLSASPLQLTYQNTVSIESLADDGGVFIETAAQLNVNSVADQTWHVRGGAQFIDVHPFSNAPASYASMRAQATNDLTAIVYEVAQQVELDSDNDIHLRATATQGYIGMWDYSSSLGFFSQTPSPLHSTSRIQRAICTQTAGGYCGSGTGGASANYASMLNALDNVTIPLRILLQRYGLLDYKTLTNIVV